MAFFLWISLALFMVIGYVNGQSNVFKVTDYGAISNGKTDCSKAFISAWNKACTTNGGLIVVPSGTYLVSSAAFEGPCNGETLFQNEGALIASSDPLLGKLYWIQFHAIDGLRIIGTGTFDGKGALAWSSRAKCDNCNFPPVSIKITNVKNALIQDIHSINSKFFHLQIVASENLLIQSVTITAPGNSPNTDGIHISASNNINITNTHISTGDDCISLGDGNTNINISRVWCGPGHGISIGSLGRFKYEKDVTRITVTNCTFTNTDNGLRIKTLAPSSVSITVSDVTFADIQVNNVQNPIIIDQHYCPHYECGHSGESDVQIKGVNFININGSSASQVAVNLQCSKLKPCQGIVFSGIDLKLKTGQLTSGSCSNADAMFHGANQVPSKCS